MSVSGQVASEAVQTFVPSGELVTMFVEGARWHLDLLKGTDEGASSINWKRPVVLDQASIPEFIAERLADVLVNRMLRHLGGHQSRTLGWNGFPTDIQEEVLELLPVREVDARHFCDRLFSEFKDYLAGGGRLSCPWGKLMVADDGALIIVRLDEVLSPVRLALTG